MLGNRLALGVIRCRFLEVDMRRFLVAFSVVTVTALVACSNNEPRRNSNVNDAGTDSSAGAGGQGGDASVDAPVETAQDAPADVPQETGPCATGSIYDLQTSKCWSCSTGSEAGPSDGGMESGSSDAGEAGGNPYRASLSCADLQSGSASYDAASNTLAIDTGYPLELQQAYYDVTYFYQVDAGNNQSREYQGFATSIQGSVIHIALPALPAGAPNSFEVNELVLTDTCGRPTVFLAPPQQCVSLPPLTIQAPTGEASAWTAYCAYCG